MSWLNQWSNEEIAYVVSASARGTNWDRMARNFNRKFDTTVSGNTLKKLYRTLTENNVDYPQEEIDFIHKCHLNLMTETQTVMAYGELFGKPLNIKRWENLLKQTPSKEIQKVMKPQKKNKNKEVKNMKRSKYTKEEIKQIRACKSAKEARALGKLFGRNPPAVERQWYIVRKKPKSISKKEKQMRTVTAKLLKAGLSNNNGYSKKQRELLGLDYWPPRRFDMESKIGDKITKKNAEKFVALKNAHIKNMGTRKKRSESKYLDVETVNRSIVVEPNITKTMWTEEQDFNILCNFYELSIDEARAKFNQPYSVIAGRLEYLVDSAEPQHHSMLIEASKVINKRKAKLAKPSKPSRRERRKARKEARLQKRLDKIKKQLRRD